MKAIVVILLAAAIGCATASLAPIEVRLGEDACAHCRMTLVSIKTAAQIVAPQDEPLMFDELGCLRDYLAAHRLAPGGRVFVADHRSGTWVDASHAVFTRTGVPTAMSSGLLAHADGASRDADPDAHGGEPAKVLP
jgi:copper chaperone NosL